MDEVEYGKKKDEIVLDKLHLPYIPLVEPLHLYHNNLSLGASPHLEVLFIIGRYGFDWDRLADTRYIKILQHKYILGLKGYEPDDVIKEIKRGWKTYSKMAVKGFRESNKVVVLKRPFWETRFGYKNEYVKGMEIWEGIWACTAAMFLGMKVVKGYIAQDAYPGTGNKGIFKEKYDNLEGVWSET